MKSLSVKLGVIFIGLAIFGCAEAWGADWKLYGSNDERLLFIDSEGISRPSSGIVRVWMKFTFTPKGILDRIDNLRKNYGENWGEKYENFEYEIALHEYNCKDKIWRYLQIVSYAKGGKTIETVDIPSEWKFITPESFGEIIYKAVCK